MPYPIKEVLFEKRFKAGFMIRHEIIDDSEWGGDGKLPMKNAYNEAGEWIGGTRDAHILCVKRGIRPEKAKPSHCVCSIGRSEQNGKWYGWSHRAISGFETKQAAMRFAESVS